MNGRATPIGPESCVSYREVWDEALTGVSVGQVLSRERYYGPGRRHCPCSGRQHGGARYRECAPGPAWSETLAHWRNLLSGNREISCPAAP